MEERVLQIVQLLKGEYPKPKTELSFKNEMQLFVAVVLSAQTTDKKVNEVTEKLFEKYKKWEDFVQADLEVLQGDIRGVNYHNTKAKRLIDAANVILTRFGGSLPRKLLQLVEIPGVARKSANVILQELWGIAEGIVVDTHVTRVSGRLELTNENSAVKIERDLMKIIPKEYWRNFSGSVVLHGRYICTARNPQCDRCVLNGVCPSAFKV